MGKSKALEKASVYDQFVFRRDVDEKVLAEKPSLWRRWWRHYTRYFCCYFAAGIIGLAIFLPLFFLYAVPAIAQKIVNDTPLPIKDASLIAINNTAVKVSMGTSITGPSGITVHLDPLTMHLYNKFTTPYTPFLSMPINGTDVRGQTDINIENQVVTIGNIDEIHKWLNITFYENKTDISVFANARAYVGALKADVVLDKTVTINALQEFDGVAISSMELVLPPESDGTNLVGELILPNRSPLTMFLGNVTANALAGDTELIIGNVSLYNVQMTPGNNTIPFRGQVFLDVVFANILTVIKSQVASLGQGQILVGISGNSSTINGEHIEYLEYILNPARLHSQVPLSQVFNGLVQSLESGNVTLSSLIQSILDNNGIQGVLGSLSGFLGGGTGNSTGSGLGSIIEGLLGSLGNSSSGGLLGILGSLFGGGSGGKLKARTELEKILDIEGAREQLEETLKMLQRIELD